MVDVRFERVLSLPATPIANTLYFVKPTGSQSVFLYATDNNGNALPVEQGQTLVADAIASRLVSVETKIDQILAALLGGVPTPGTNPTLSLSSAVSQPEGNSGTTAFIWTLTLNRDGSTAAFPFMWTVAGNGSSPAEASDFGGTYPVGGGTFAPGETTKQIIVLATGDTANEPNETFALTVTATGLNTVTSIGTITNDDATAPTYAITQGDIVALML